MKNKPTTQLSGKQNRTKSAVVVIAGTQDGSTHIIQNAVALAYKQGWSIVAVFDYLFFELSIMLPTKCPRSAPCIAMNILVRLQIVKQ